MTRIGVAIGSRRDSSNDEIIALAQRAEALGYTSLWVGESWGRDAFTLLSMIACHTSTIQLGTGIVPVFSRTPALIAQSIASLDIVSGGRAVLGLGTSGRMVIEQWHGEKYEGPLQRTREYISIIRSALAGERVDHQGKFFNLQRFRMAFSPLQERIPIYVAALGPKNVALTGELADGWLPTWVDVRHLPQMKQQLEQSALKVGRAAGEVTVAPQLLAMVASTGPRREEARRQLQAHMAYYVGGMGRYYFDLFQRYGYVDEAQAVRDAWESGERERSASLVTDDMLNNITITGDPKECRARLEAYRQAGADMPVIGFPHGAEPDAIYRTMEALAPASS